MSNFVGRAIAALLVTLMLPAIFIVFALVCLTAIVKTMTEDPSDPEYWE